MYCENCSCDHVDHQSRRIIPSIPSQLAICSQENIQIENPELRHRFKLPLNKAVLSGIACLDKGTVAAIDYENRMLYGFSTSEKVINLNLNLAMEPKALTTIHGRKIAISFAYERLIRIFEIHIEKVVEIVQERISLKTKGKPFSISYSNDMYAVEIAERKLGFIAIIDSKGNIEKQIPNNGYSFGFFTSNNLRLALDMNKILFYASAIGKKSIYCVDFDGKVKWHIRVPSPRGLQLVPATSDTTHILIASNKRNSIYQLLEKDQHLNAKQPKGRILKLENVCNPEYVGYNADCKLISIGMEDGTINVYHIKEGI